MTLFELYSSYLSTSHKEKSEYNLDDCDYLINKCLEKTISYPNYKDKYLNLIYEINKIKYDYINVSEESYVDEITLLKKRLKEQVRILKMLDDFK